MRLFISAVGFFTMASRALAVVIGFQIYRITRDPLSLGWLGLIEAIPAISLVLFGGYVADHFDRRKILLMTRAASILCAIALVLLSWKWSNALLGLYGVIFLAGVARGFAEPAAAAFEAQIVPKELTVNASSWISSTWLASAVVGPALIGFIFDAWGAAVSYLSIAAGFVAAWVCTFLIPARLLVSPQRASIFRGIGVGWQFVWKHPVLLNALMLDLFAVFFGGAVALLPIYADEILRVGARGLGFLNAAPSFGALVTMLWATRQAPLAHAGRNLLLTVAGFGISILVFAFSKNFWLSMISLFFSGVFDGVSVVIRRSMVRLLSPEHLRGRVAATNFIFISSSNELGAFESGMLASWIGTIPCVAVGGVITLVVVGVTAAFAPKLRQLRFDFN
ncbi:MAG: MFS transporter [Candidatus Omnitrophica bacterium]|nr:MFS transporter [Candidatus Omnitrophota bacterium]